MTDNELLQQIADELSVQVLWLQDLSYWLQMIALAVVFASAGIGLLVFLWTAKNRNLLNGVLLFCCVGGYASADPLTDHPAWLLGTESGIPFSIDSDDYTISVVFNVTGTTGMVGFDSEHFRVAQMVNGMGLTYVWNGTSYAQNYFSGPKVWNRWTVSKSGSSLKFWANGVLMFDKVAVDGGSLTPRVGVSSGGGGRVSSVEVWADAQDGSLSLTDPDAVFVPDEDAGSSREQISETWFPWSGAVPTLAFESDNPGDVLDDYGSFEPSGYMTFLAQAEAAGIVFDDPPQVPTAGNQGNGQCVLGYQLFRKPGTDGNGDYQNVWELDGQGGNLVGGLSYTFTETEYGSHTWTAYNGSTFTTAKWKLAVVYAVNDYQKCAWCSMNCPPCDPNGDDDGDGILNSVEDDIDGDGIPDDQDYDTGCNTPDLNGCGAGGDWDGDGWRNDSDPEGDADNDGIPDDMDTSPYGCPTGNNCDGSGDSDGDGIRNDHDPDYDMDGDGIEDSIDVSPYGTSCGLLGSPCELMGDADGDGIRNDKDDDNDMDGDGEPDDDDLTPRGSECDYCATGKEELIQAGKIVETSEGCFTKGNMYPDSESGELVEDESQRVPLGEADDFNWGPSGECDWDGDGCLNHEDPAPCDPEVKCGCVFDFDKKLKRVETALLKWAYADDRHPREWSDDPKYTNGQGNSQTGGGFIPMPQPTSGNFGTSISLDLSSLGVSEPLNLMYRPLPTGSDYAGYGPTVVAFIDAFRSAWSYFRALLVIYFAWVILMRIWDDLSLNSGTMTA